MSLRENKALDIKAAIKYVNDNFYSQPMTVFNHGGFELPFIPPLHKIMPPITKVTDGDFSAHIRKSHGLLHVYAAMKLIDDIDAHYIALIKSHNEFDSFMGENYYTQAIESLGGADNCLHLVKLAALFHDSGRQGDGVDLWDDNSADNFADYLRQAQCDPKVVNLGQALVRYKDDTAGFYAYCLKHVFDTEEKTVQADYLRQLLNMADSLEVIRCRDNFDVSYTPIAKELDPDLFLIEVFKTCKTLLIEHPNIDIDRYLAIQQQKYLQQFVDIRQGNEYINILLRYNNELRTGNNEISESNKQELCNHCDDIIAVLEDKLKDKNRSADDPIVQLCHSLIAEHRRTIVTEGRLGNFAGRINFPGYDDWVNYQHHVVAAVGRGYDFDKMGRVAKQIYQDYELTPYTAEDGMLNIGQAVTNAKQAINAYDNKYQADSFTFFHNGEFNPRYHGWAGKTRALRFRELLNDPGLANHHPIILYSLIASFHGQSLQDEVMRMMGNSDKQSLLTSLKRQLKQDYEIVDNDDNKFSKLNLLNQQVKVIIDYVEGRTSSIPNFENVQGDYFEGKCP